MDEFKETIKWVMKCPVEAAELLLTRKDMIKELSNGTKEDSNINFKQAWKDLRKDIIDQITDKEDDILYASDLKHVMDEMVLDYKGD